MPAKVIYLGRIKQRRSIGQLARWWIQRIRGRDKFSLMKRQAPDLYWLVQSGQADARIDANGDVCAVRFLLETLQDSNLAFLAHLPKLKTLHILHCEGITNDALKHVEQTAELRSVNLEGTGISGFGLRYLARHTQLERLSLGATAIGTVSPDSSLSLSAKAYSRFWNNREAVPFPAFVISDPICRDALTTYSSGEWRFPLMTDIRQPVSLQEPYPPLWLRCKAEDSG